MNELPNEFRRDDGLLMADRDAGPGVPNRLGESDWENMGEKAGGIEERG